MGLLLLFGTAHALSTFPGQVETDAGMSCTPTCMLCHSTPAGGSGTATQPFAAALLENGLNIGDATTLTSALDAVQAAGSTYDSDGDGINDVDELVAGTNPNPGGTDFCSVNAPPAVERGCFNGTAAASGIGLGVMALTWRRRRG